MSLRRIFICLALCWTTLAQGQILMERQVIGVCGVEGGNGFTVLSTAGEPVITTLSSPNNYLTQGYHQPRSKQQLNVLFTLKTPCAGLPNGSVNITAIEGCDEDEVTIFWNGEPGNFSFENWGPDSLTLEVFAGVECQYNYTFHVPSPDAFCDLTLYNIITPNGDGANDKWIIENIEQVPDSRVTIVNRSGQQVRKIEGYNNETAVWEGKDDKGRDLPNGTYFYLLEAQGQQLKGFVELLR